MTRQPRRSNHVLFGSTGAAAVPSGTFRGLWDDEIEYQPGDSVMHGTGRYVAVDGAAAGDAPHTVMQSLSVAPANTDTTDGAEYELVSHFNWGDKGVRVTGVGFPKTALQVAVPHTLKFWDKAFALTAPILTTQVAGEGAGASGLLIADCIVDTKPGATYAASYVVGTGSDAGYRHQAGFAFPVQVGSLHWTGAGFSTVGNISGPNVNNGTNFGAFVRWEEPHDSWTLIGRLDPVVAGNSRALSRAPF